MLRVYGRPEQKLEVGVPSSVAEVEELSLAQIRELRRLHAVE